MKDIFIIEYIVNSEGHWMITTAKILSLVKRKSGLSGGISDNFLAEILNIMKILSKKPLSLIHEILL